jgi:hypothetical protein
VRADCKTSPRDVSFTPDSHPDVGGKDGRWELGWSGGTGWGPERIFGEAWVRNMFQDGLTGRNQRFAGMIVEVTVTFEDD